MGQGAGLRREDMACPPSPMAPASSGGPTRATTRPKLPGRYDGIVTMNSFPDCADRNGSASPTRACSTFYFKHQAARQFTADPQRALSGFASSIEITFLATARDVWTRTRARMDPDRASYQANTLTAGMAQLQYHPHGRQPGPVRARDRLSTTRSSLRRDTRPRAGLRASGAARQRRGGLVQYGL
jgi:hypothetical protein